MSRVAISVTAQGGLDPLMDPRFGRAEAFVVLTEGRIVERMANPHKEAGHGAGPAVAAWMGELGVKDVISGEFGPKALLALSAIRITPWIAPPGLPASEVHRLFTEGRLERKELKVLR